MADRMDVLTAREYESNGQKKTSWTKVGVAFKAREGEGWNIQLDALPVNGKLVLREPRQSEDRGGSNGSQRRQAPPRDDEGSTPF